MKQDLINRDLAIEIFEIWRQDCEKDGKFETAKAFEDAIERLGDIPSRVHETKGHWVGMYKMPLANGESLILAECSECGETRPIDTYCSSCGSINIEEVPDWLF